MSKNQVDENFYQRADEMINLANKQLENIDYSRVSASMMFACARFNAFMTATKAEDKTHLADSKHLILDYFVKEYEKMLKQNLEEYIENFDQYLGRKKN